MAFYRIFHYSREIPPGAIYTHTWKSGDLIIWDNASLLHRLGEYDLLNQVRVMRRCVVLGDEQVNRTGGLSQIVGMSSQ